MGFHTKGKLYGCHQATDYYPQQSRDYALSNTIQCECKVCPVNKNGYCEVPSLIQITSGGRCKVGQSFLTNDTPIKKTRKPKDGK